MKVGYGKACITPPIGVATILGLEAELIRVLDDLFVRAVCIEAGGQRVLVAAADLIGLDPADSADFVARIAEVTGIPSDHIVVHVIHTHQTANSHWETASLLEPYGLADAYCSWSFRALVEGGLVRAARQAVERLSPCEMCFATAAAEGIASNRRVPVPGEVGRVLFRESRPNAELRKYPEGPIDPLVRLVLFRLTDTGEMIGITNYNCHPTSAGGDGGAYATGDFPGIGMSMAEGDTPGLYLMHLTGTCGEINPGKYISSDSYQPEYRQRDTWRLGARYAGAISTAVNVACASQDWQTAETLQMAACNPLKMTVSPALPSETDVRARVGEAVAAYRVQKPGGAQPRQPFQRDLRKLMVWWQTHAGVLHTQAAALRVGKVLFSFLPGEIFLQFGNLLRMQLGEPALVNAAYCFGSDFGYVVPPEAFAQGGYEPTATSLAPTAYDELASQVLELLRRVGAD